MTLPDTVGFVGALLLVAMYLMSLRGTIDTAGLVYPAANLLGCVLIVVSLWFSFNLPSFLIELFWGSVSGYGIARWAARRRVG